MRGVVVPNAKILSTTEAVPTVGACDIGNFFKAVCVNDSAICLSVQLPSKISGTAVGSGNFEPCASAMVNNGDTVNMHPILSFPLL